MPIRIPAGVMLLLCWLPGPAAFAAPDTTPPPVPQITPVPTPMPPAPVAPVVQPPSPTYALSPACEIGEADLTKASTDMQEAQARLATARQGSHGQEDSTDVKKAKEALAVARSEQDKANDEVTAGHCR